MRLVPNCRTSFQFVHRVSAQHAAGAALTFSRSSRRGCCAYAAALTGGLCQTTAGTLAKALDGALAYDQRCSANNCALPE